MKLKIKDEVHLKNQLLRCCTTCNYIIQGYDAELYCSNPKNYDRDISKCIAAIAQVDYTDICDNYEE